MAGTARKLRQGRTLDPEARKLGGDCAKALVLSLGELIVDYEVLAFDVAELTHSLCEPGIEARFQRRRPSAACNKTNARYLRRLLRPHRDRPRRRRAAEQCDELAPPHHSITASARASNAGGTSSPSAFAVFRLIASVNLTGPWMVGHRAFRLSGYGPRKTPRAELGPIDPCRRRLDHLLEQNQWIQKPRVGGGASSMKRRGPDEETWRYPVWQSLRRPTTPRLLRSRARYRLRFERATRPLRFAACEPQSRLVEKNNCLR